MNFGNIVDNLKGKFSKGNNYHKQEISKITDIIPKEINIKNELEYFKQSIKTIKIIFAIIAILLLVLIIVLLIR